MAALANPSEERRARYGAIVVGSGYGGSIVAARLAEAGHDVCILERGQEWQTGQFPDELDALRGELRSADNPLGLYDYHVGDDLDVYSGNALGGTSLINANVALRPDRSVFGRARWPAAIQDAAAREELDGYYARAAAMLEVAEPNPRLTELTKHRVLAKAAAARGAAFTAMPLTVNIDKYDGPNAQGVVQRPCTRCGDCVTGCNVGAKNSLITNYLPFARSKGAEIYTQIEVRCVLPAPEGGYHVIALCRTRDGRPPVETAMHASLVVLAAGALGSTGLLLASRDRGLRVSRRLGHHFSGNGDLLTLGYNNDEVCDVLGYGRRALDPQAPLVGPTITGAAEYRDATGDRRLSIQEGAFPLALVDATRAACAAISWTGDDTDAGFRDAARELARVMRDFAGRDPRGALNHSMLLLGMGHDGANGRVVLDHRGRPRVLWRGLADLPIYDELNREMRGLTAALGGTYLRSPRMSKLFGANAITVHPLGGCPMGNDADTGVVDHAGRVFDPDGTVGAVHDGLFVADAAVIPTSLGVNPLLTISALAERIAERMTRALGVPRTARTAVLGLVQPGDAPPGPPPGPLPGPLPSLPPGLEWTEVMRGHVTRDVTFAATPDEYRAAAKRAIEQGGAIEYRVTVLVDDLPRFLDDAQREAPAEGHIESAEFGRVQIDDGRFNLFCVDQALGHRRHVYRLAFVGTDGRRYLLDGFKDIHDDPGFDLWSDNTTLFTSIRDGWSTDAPVIAQGIIHVRARDFLKQLTTFRIRNNESGQQSQAWLGRFGAFFFGELWETYVRHQLPDGADAAP